MTRTRRWDRVAVAAISAIALVAVAASAVILASGVGPEPVAPTGVSGTIRGVMVLVGGPANIVTPAAGSIAAHWVPGKYTTMDTPTFTTATDANGAFSMVVPPGQYNVSGTSDQYDSGQGVCRTYTDVTVAPGGTADVVVSCQMK